MIYNVGWFVVFVYFDLNWLHFLIPCRFYYSIQSTDIFFQLFWHVWHNQNSFHLDFVPNFLLLVSKKTLYLS